MVRSFVKYVMRFYEEESAWGDLARDVAQDPEIQPGWSARQLRKHLESKTQWEPVFQVLDEMAEAFLKNL